MMDREEFGDLVAETMHVKNISYEKAFNLIFEEDMKQLEERRLKEYDDVEVAEANLRNNKNSKTVVIAIDELCSKGQAIQIAMSEIKVKKQHFLSELSKDGLEKWLVASEFDITHNDTLRILHGLESEKYSSPELESIISNHAPFDIR